MRKSLKKNEKKRNVRGHKGREPKDPVVSYQVRPSTFIFGSRHKSPTQREQPPLSRRTRLAIWCFIYLVISANCMEELQRSLRRMPKDIIVEEGLHPNPGPARRRVTGKRPPKMEEEKEEVAAGKRLQKKEDAVGHHQSPTPGSSSWEPPFVPFLESLDPATGEGGAQATGEKGDEKEGVKGMGRRGKRKGLLLQNVTKKPRNPHLTQPEPPAPNQPCREPPTDPKQNLGKKTDPTKTYGKPWK